MIPEQVLAHPATVLSDEQRRSYFEDGYLLLDRIVPDDWLERLREVTAGFVEQSRALTKSDAIFDLEPGHTAEEPRLRRLTSPVEQHGRTGSLLQNRCLPTSQWICSAPT